MQAFYIKVVTMHVSAHGLWIPNEAFFHRNPLLAPWNPFVLTPPPFCQLCNEAFFHWNPELLGLGRQFGQINFGVFLVFAAVLSAPILVLWVPCPCFPWINHYFYKKLSLYIQIPNINLGFNFWAAKNQGFSHRVTVVCV